jgi:hypothetical protein
MRQKSTVEMELPLEDRGEALNVQRSGEAGRAAKGETRSGIGHERLMELVVERENFRKALKRVRQNKGSPGVDGMRVEDLTAYLTASWAEIREQLLMGTYQPMPVRRVEIPKSGGGVRQLGIPTVLDRFVQQLLLQVLQPRFDPTFSEHSHGFPPGRRAHDGSHVSAETSRRLSCDAALVRVRHAAGGSILDVGRRTRTIPPALRRALEVRDRGCRFPGCESRFCDAHHVRHWGQGGETSLSNTVLLCAVHHRLVHEGGWRVGWGALGEPVFLDPRGGVHYDARPRAPELPSDPVAALVEEHRARGIEPDWGTAGRRWGRWRLAG